MVDHHVDKGHTDGEFGTRCTLTCMHAKEQVYSSAPSVSLLSHLLSVPRVLDLQPVTGGQDLHVVGVRGHPEGTVVLRSLRARPGAAAAAAVVVRVAVYISVQQ